MNTNANYVMDWDSEIEHESAEFVLLPDGDYDFEVIDFERARHGGSAKLPPCPKAIVTVKIHDINDNVTIIKHNFFLHSSCEGMICAFFTCVGLRRKGERFQMAWDKIVGCKGRCKVTQRKYTGSDGNEYTTNEIRKFYEPVAEPAKAWNAGQF